MAYRALQEEHRRLLGEVEALRECGSVSGIKQAATPPTGRELSAGGCDTVGGDVGTQGAAAPKDKRMRYSKVDLTVNGRMLIGERRNARLARLQHLIANIDPEESGAWARQELTVDVCMEVLVARDVSEISTERVEEIMEGLGRHLEKRSAACGRPLKMHLLNLTSLEDLEDVFGDTLVEDVMRLQDALAADLTNQLVSMYAAPTRLSIVDVLSGKSAPRRLFDKCCNGNSMLQAVEIIGTFLVAVNTVVLGMSVDIEPTWKGWDILSAVFAVAFLVELLARMALSGGPRTFLCGPSWRWHLLDTSIVSLALFDIVTLLAVQVKHSNTRVLMLVRMARLLRLTRITRLARTGIFHELIYMVKGIEAGTTTLMWALVLLMSVCYTTAVVLTQTIGRDDGSYIQPYVERHFSSVLLTMFTLFRCFTGDCTCYDGVPMSYVLVRQYGQFAIVVFWLTTMGVTVGLFNVVIANFLQTAQRASRFSDSERRRILRKEREMVNTKTAKLMTRIQGLYMTSRRSRAGQSMADLKISREMFFEMLRDPEINDWLDDMGCDDALRMKLFDKIDVDGNGVVETVELVSGIVELVRGRFDNIEGLFGHIRSINARLARLQATVILGKEPKESASTSL